jgi:hypothetical protein
MKNIVFLLMVCVCILTPAAARADDGGFWDMLWHWDLKFSGYGTDIHLYCRDDMGARVFDCDEWFRNILHNPFRTSDIPHTFKSFESIKHEVNLRVSVMHSYGQRTPDFDDGRKVWALKTMGIYDYRIDKLVDVGGGAGTIEIFGQDVERVWRPIVTGGVTIGLGGAWFARAEESYLWGTITGADLGHPTSTFSAGPKSNFSVTVGVDFRRGGRYGVAR